MVPMVPMVPARLTDRTVDADVVDGADITRLTSIPRAFDTSTHPLLSLDQELVSTIGYSVTPRSVPQFLSD